MMHRTGYAVAKMERSLEKPGAMEVWRIRDIASSVEGVKEISLDSTSKVISFLNVDWECRFNVYYTTGTVVTSMNHPYAGKTQLFRRGVDYHLLEKIFDDPRVHSDIGYYHTDLAPSKMRFTLNHRDVINDNVEDEETELRRQLDILQPQVDMIRSQLATLVVKRAEEEAAEEAQRERERVRQEEAMRKEIEEREEVRLREAKAKQRAEEEQRRIAEAEAQAERAARARREQTAHSRLVNARGNSCEYSLRDEADIPQSMVDVASMAHSNGGSVTVYECGHCTHHGVCADLAEALERQHCTHIQYVAAGPEGQYFIRKTNGKFLYRGCDEFTYTLNRSCSPVSLVAFGDFETFCVRFEDGSTAWSRGLEDLLPANVIEILDTQDVQTVWLGSHRRLQYSMYRVVHRIGYYIGYNGGSCAYAHLPDGVQVWLDEKKPTVKVKQVLADERDNYFIRYS